MNRRGQVNAIVFTCVTMLTACTISQVTSATPSPVPAITIAPTAIPNPGEYITVAQINFWFYGPGPNGGFEAGDGSGKRTTPFTPALGDTYRASNPHVVEQQIDWAADYGVDAFSVEWTTPRGVGCCGSMEDTLDDVFLKARNLDRTRWVIFYDLVLRILQTPGLQVNLSRGMDFDDPDVYDTFVYDMERFAGKYFKEPHYLTIDDRPVVYIWGTWNAIGRFPEAFKEARQKVADLGYDVYLVGDVLREDVFNPDLASAYDANTNFTFLIPGTPPFKDVGQAAVAQGRVFEKWRSWIQGLKVDGREENVILQPGWAPQYDDRMFKDWQNQEGIYVPATSKDQVLAMAELSRQYAQPAGSQGWKLVWINTWNNWPESTTIEPTADHGPKYPAGNYQFDFLEIVRDVFGAETFGTGPTLQ
jgi:hypothetical protein